MKTLFHRIVGVGEFFFNPVFVRTLRQAVRSGWITAIILLFLLVLTAISLLFLSFQTEYGSDDYLPFTPTGFAACLIGFAFLCSLSVSLNLAANLVWERLGGDLMYFTTLSPSAFVLGKWVTGFVVSALFYTMTLPFLTVALTLPGVDIRIIVIGLVFTFATVQGVNLWAIACFSGTSSVASAVMRGFWFFFVTLKDINSVYYMYFQAFFVGYGAQEHLYSLEFWVFWFFLNQVLMFVFLFALARCQFAPVESNRMGTFRIVMTLALSAYLAANLLCAGLLEWLIPGIAPMYGLSDSLFWHTFLSLPLYLAFSSSVFYSCYIAMAERPYYGNRLRASIPKSGLKRLLVFPFYSGDCNGLVWVAGAIILASLGFLFMESPLMAFAHGPNFAERFKHYKRFLPEIQLHFFYVVFSLFLWEVLFHRWIEKHWIALLTVCLLLLSFPVSILAMTSVSGAFDFDDMMTLFPFYRHLFFFSYGYPEPTIYTRYFAYFLFIAALGLLALLTMKRLKQFQQDVSSSMS